NVCGALYRRDARRGHGRVLVFGGALPAADDGAGVAHAAPRRGRLPGDEADHGLLDVVLDVRGCDFFRIAADLADQDDGVGVRVGIEELDGIEKRRSDDRVATDADAGGLADAKVRQLAHRFVGERAAAAYHAHVAFLVDAAGHDPDLALARGDDAGAVGADQAGPPAANHVP